jgi:hypothetical protein
VKTEARVVLDEAKAGLPAAQCQPQGVAQVSYTCVACTVAAGGRTENRQMDEARRISEPAQLNTALILAFVDRLSSDLQCRSRNRLPDDKLQIKGSSRAPRV